MASKEECDRYAEELAHRFDDLTRWAIANWPDKNLPLLTSDFAESRRELSTILGSKLQEIQGETRPNVDGSAQYIDMNPAPWP
jgi:hypothetical protein